MDLWICLELRGELAFLVGGFQCGDRKLPEDFDLDLFLCGDRDLLFLSTEEVDLLPWEPGKGDAEFDGAGPP